jgi:integrase
VVGLQVEDVNLAKGELRFYRPKVDKVQTHRLTITALAAIRGYLEKDHLVVTGKLLLGSQKSGLLSGEMSERAITKRVAVLGKTVGLIGLSAHDCRHYWATQAARHGTPLDRLQDAGGWSSLAMPSRYIEAAKIANHGVNLGDE